MTQKPTQSSGAHTGFMVTHKCIKGVKFTAKHTQTSGAHKHSYTPNRHCLRLSGIRHASLSPTGPRPRAQLQA